MAEYLAKNDIFDQDGRLLLRKGHKVTDEIIARLKTHGSYELEELIEFKEKQSSVLAPTINEFRVRMNIHDERILEQLN